MNSPKSDAVRRGDEVITDAIDTHVQAEQTKHGDDEDGPTGVLVATGKWPGRYVMLQALPDRTSEISH